MNNLKFNFKMLYPIVGFALFGLFLVAAFYGIGFRIDLVDQTNYYDQTNTVIIKLSNLYSNSVNAPNSVLINDIHNLGSAAVATAFLGMLIPFGLGFLPKEKVKQGYILFMLLMNLAIFTLTIASSILFLKNIHLLYDFYSQNGYTMAKGNVGGFVGFYILFAVGFVLSVSLTMRTSYVKNEKITA